MNESGDSVAAVSDPRVQAALERIADSAGIDLNAMPEVLEDVYRRLNSALADNPSGEVPSANGHRAYDAQAATEPSEGIDPTDSPDPNG